MGDANTMTRLDRVLMAISPAWALSRLRSRTAATLVARNYEAASSGRRTQNWTRRLTDANAAAGPALSTLRAHSRDLVRNNAWARNSIRVINRNVVGWGIMPKTIGMSRPDKLRKAWEQWAGTTECDAAGRLTFSGLEKLVMRSIAEAGEVLVRRRWRRPEDGLALPLQLQVLEPDYLDTTKNVAAGAAGGPIIYGVEFDAIGRRVAYWLFENHPGSNLQGGTASRRIPASEIIHAFDVERPGQERGVPWLAAAIVNLKDFDEFEDAALMRQKIAACFAAFVTDLDGGGGGAIGEASTDDPLIETLEPGMIQRLPLGKDVKFGNPPSTTDDAFSTRALRRIAAAIGITYEDLSGDYSQVNFSSARMSRMAHWGNVYDWQWNLLIPNFCDPAWKWAMEAAALAGLVSVDGGPRAEWTPQPMPLTEPDREARANVIMVRSGQKTLSQVIREQGGDPDAHLEEYAADMEKLDEKGIWLDSDVRRVSQAGLTQLRAGAGAGGGAAPGEAPAASEAPPEDGEDPPEDPAAS
jgi:lambda family phage portal protein